VLLQVTSADVTLHDMRLDLSSSRVAGCFMLTNLQELQQQLLTVQGQLQATARHECCYGVRQQLARAQQLQQDMLGTVQVGIGTPLALKCCAVCICVSNAAGRGAAAAAGDAGSCGERAGED
jgi:hypothetical protein